MSKNEVLYVKGMDLSASETEGASEDNDGDIWDDKKLNDAYDKALKIANAEVARRVAMSTNTQQGAKDHSNAKHPQPKQPKPSSMKKLQWKAGMPCRAIYEEDGVEYEASVVRIINEKECVVRFLGYENSELVTIADLKPTLGKNARTLQIEQAEIDDKASGISTTSHSADRMLGSDRPMSPASSDRSFQKKSKKPNKKRKTVNPNPSNPYGLRLPEMPGSLPLPDASFMRKLGSLEMPIPPPPPLTFSSDRLDSEEQAISSMLLSWYMSGYYTGLYQGLKRSKANNRKS